MVETEKIDTIIKSYLRIISYRLNESEVELTRRILASYGVTDQLRICKGQRPEDHSLVVIANQLGVDISLVENTTTKFAMWITDGGMQPI